MDKGRIIAEHKDRYDVSLMDQVYSAELLGHLRFNAESREELPVVGDWVELEPYDGNHAIIHSVIDRNNILERQAVGGHGETQIIAANIDYAFIVQALDRDYNINRIERYLTLCNANEIDPIIILNKADLRDENEVEDVREELESRVNGIPILVTSNETRFGFEYLEKHLIPGKTYCMLGSSGVGKSTMINNLIGDQVLETKSISSSNNKGRHTTTNRELFTLPNGSFIIDNPGMREVGLTDSDSGLDETFEVIVKLGEGCHYSDCSHTTETGCKVLEALENGDIAEAYYDNYLRLNREKEHFKSTRQERKKKGKDIAKLLKNYKKVNYKGK